MGIWNKEPVSVLVGLHHYPTKKEIRKIDSYAPGIAISIEGNATKWFDPKWGMTVGVRLENKNMTTEATVKNYGMKIINTNGGELQDYGQEE